MAYNDFLWQSERIVIRRWQRQDYHTMDRWPPFADPLSMIWNLPDRVTANPRSWGPDIRRTYAVQLHSGELIGRITLRDIDTLLASARLGITIGSPYVSQGLGTEALALFLDAFFSVLRFKIMVLDVASVNERAVRCYERLGFQHIGQHWRDAGARFMATLPDETRLRIEPFVRHGRYTVWIQFYDMQLHREQWLSHRPLQLARQPD